MSITPSTASVASPAVATPAQITARLALFTLIVFLGYGAIGLPLGVLPSQIHETLGYGTLVVGLAVAFQSVATLLTRPLAGSVCDTRGGKISGILGTACLCAAGVFYLASFAITAPLPSLAVLLIGRGFAGFGESFIVTGSLAWCIAAIGPAHTGRAMVWIGIAMYGAIALGAPVGLALDGWAGFAAVAIITALLPLIGGLMALAVADARTPGGMRLPFLQVLGLIWRQGTGLALSAFGVGAVSAFVALYFKAQNWDGAGLALSAVGVAYILARLLAGHLPDRIGGTGVAIGSLIVEIVGLLLMWAAATPTMAIAAAFLTGAGFALVFPSFGVIAVKRVPPASRGAALGGYVAFFDIGLAITGPTAGLVAASYGYSAIFAAGAIAALLAIVLAAREGYRD